CEESAHGPLGFVAFQHNRANYQILKAHAIVVILVPDDAKLEEFDSILTYTVPSTSSRMPIKK
ncbi:unnamed protein product, partial [Dovyalis caffra]